MAADESILGADEMLEMVGQLVAMINRRPVFQLGTVTQTTPLLVHLDGDVDANGAPVSVPAQALVTAIPVGRRVQCLEQDRRVNVITVAEA